MQISLYPKYHSFDKVLKWTRVIWTMGNQTLMWLQQRFQSHCLWIIPETNLSQAILESGLRQQKDRKAERLIRWEKETFWLCFLRNKRCTCQIINQWFQLLFQNSVILWRWVTILNGEELHCAIINPKWSTKLSSLQDAFPTVENTDHQSSFTELGFSFLTQEHHLISYFSGQSFLSTTPVYFW